MNDSGSHCLRCRINLISLGVLVQNTRKVPVNEFLDSFGRSVGSNISSQPQKNAEDVQWTVFQVDRSCSSEEKLGDP